MSVIGNAIFGGASAYNQGKAQEAANKANAASAAAQSVQVGVQAAAKINTQAESGEKQLGAVRAAYGASGISAVGSARDVIGMDRSLLVQKIQNIDQTAKFEQGQLQGEAAGYLTQAQYAGNAAKWGALTGVAGTYGGIASTFSPGPSTSVDSPVGEGGDPSGGIMQAPGVY